MEKKYKNWTTAYAESVKESVEVTEAPLVMSDRDVMDTVLLAIKREFDTQVKRSPEKALVLMQQLGKIVGYGITKSNQSKGKSFRYDLKK